MPIHPWTGSQRGVMVALLSAVLVYLIIRLALNPVYVSNPQPQNPPHANDLADRIDPNTADVNALAVLPMIGEKRAGEIVAYREKFAAEHPGRPAFRKLDDLMLIRGIGPAMIEHWEPFLIFPTSQPASAPVN